MRKVLHKVKSQWVVLGVLGATVVSLGTADVRQVAASEIEGASTSETLTAREIGTADIIVEAAEKAAHIGLDHAVETATTDGTATVFVHWNEDGTITVTVKDLNGSVLHSDLLVDSEGENTIKVLTASQDYYTINIAVKTAATEQTTTATGPIEQAVPVVLAEVDAVEEVVAEESDYAKIVSTTEVDYPAVIARATDAINTAPWGVEGYQTLASSSDYAGKTVDVTKEQVTDYGVTWALVSLNGKELGWIAKDALTVQTYAAIISETVVDYPATIKRGTDAINLAPWGTKGFQTIASSATYVGKTVEVIKEQTTDYGVTWAQISLNGEVLGWIAKDALAVQTYAAVVSETVVDYPATVNRDSDAINTAPWGVKGYQTLSSSAAYTGQTVEVIKEQVTDYGVTWAQISLNGEVLGWIAKDALKIQTYAQITKETAVDYSATISRDSDAINTAPWGVKGYRTLSSSAAFVGQTVEVTKEQVTDYGVTWAQISLNGEVLGWIAKDALKVQTYAQITKETAVSYDAIVNRDSDAINTAPWGVKGYQTLFSSAAYVDQTVEVIKEQVTDYGVTWAQISLNGEALGWIAKDALKVQTYAQITKETAVSYDAIVNRDSDAINTAPWGVKGYQTLSSSAAYEGQTVEVTKEQVTDYGVTWALVSQNGKELGWIAKDALKVQTYAQIVSENEVAYPALINRGTDAINTAPWGTKGYQTNASSADYLGQTVEVTKEQTTDYGVTWALVSMNGKELGWIAKDALTILERTVETVVAKENTVAYQTVTEEDNTIPTGESQIAQAGVDGFDTVTYDVTYVNGVETNRVEVSRTTTAPVTKIVKVGTQVTEVKIETTTENEVAFTTVEEEDNTIPTGERIVVQAGVNGYDTVTFDVTFVNGVETNRVEVSRTTTAPVAEVVKVGTQVTEIKSESTTENEVDFATVEEEDNTIPTGERVVVQAGVKGYDTVSYDVTYVNGIETNRVEISRTTTAPVSEIVKVGTQVTEVKPEPTTENEVAYATVEEEDNTIPTGERIVVQVGANGYDTVTYDVTYVNGVETNRVETSRTTTAPVAEIVKVGTQVTETKSETTTETEVDFTTIEEFDNTILTGERIVVQAGVKGYDTVTYDVTYVNGVETNRVEISRTTTAPVSKIVKVGTQVTEIKSETTNENEVAFATVEEQDNTIPTGERVVVQAGVKGYDTVSYDVTYVNGIETNRVEVSRTTTASVAEVVKVGTQVTEVKIETTTENEVGFATVEEEDNTIPTGDRVVVQAGVNGYDTVSYDVTYVNGVETNRVEVSRATTAPVAEVIKVGTQVTEVTQETTTENEIDFNILEEEDNTIPTGERVVVQAGVNGYDTVTYDVIYVNGTETNRVEISRTTTAFVSEIIKVGTQITEVRSEATVENEVAYETVEEEDNTIPIGERVVVQAGANGYDTVTYDVTYVNGIETNRIEVSRTTTASVSEIVKVGMQVTEVKSETTTENEVAYATIEEEDNTIPIGERVIVQAGVKGYDIVTYDVTYVNEIETDRVETGRITTAVVDEIVRIGTKRITITSEGNDGIVLTGNTLQLSVENADSTIIWTVENVTGTASIDNTGLLTATNAGKVIVKATSDDVSGIQGIMEIIVAKPLTINGYYGSGLEIIIPEKIDGSHVIAGVYNGFNIGEILGNEDIGIVTTIGDNAFKSKNLISIVLPDSVATIGQEAFGYNNLTSVVIPNSVKNIGALAFWHNQLTSAQIGDQVKIIGGNAFSHNQLENIVIPNSVVTIEGSAFYVNQISNLVIGSSVTKIGNDAFSDNKLSSIIIPDSVTMIDDRSFYNNTLTSVELGEDLAYIGQYAFGNNILTNLTIPESVTSIADFAFIRNQLKEVNISNSVTNIGDAAFRFNNLTSLNIPDSVLNIGRYSFGDNQLTSVAIGSNVTTIEAYAFKTNKLTSIVIPDGVTTIESEAFSANDLTQITIGEGVIIGEFVLGNNNHFRDVYTIGGAGIYVGTQNGLWEKVLTPDIQQPIARIGGFNLTDLFVNSDVVYVGDWGIGKTVTMKVSSTSSMILNAHFNYKLPSGGYGQEAFVYVGSDTYEATIPTYIWGVGTYQADSIFLTDSNGNSWVIMSEGNGTGYNYTSADLSGADFEILKKPVFTTETATETVPFQSIKQEDSSLFIGETKVIQTGINGVRTNTYSVSFIDGMETNRELTSSVVTTTPIDEIIAVGTKQPIAIIGGFTLKEFSVGDEPVYDNGWGSYKTITMKLIGNNTSVAKASLDYRLPSGSSTQVDFTSIGNETYTASIPTMLGGAGIYHINSITLYDLNGNFWIIFPQNAGYGSNYNYVSADLGTTYFEILSKNAVTTDTVQIVETVQFETNQQIDPLLPVGDTKVIQTGVNGFRTAYYTVTYTGGVETSRELINSVITTAPVSEIIAIGTKQPIAEVGGFTVKDLYFEDSVVYGSVEYKVLRMVATDDDSVISKAHATYKLAEGGYTQFQFSCLGNGIFEAHIPTYYGSGLNQLDSLYLEDAQGRWTNVISSTTNEYDSYLDSLYADLSEGDFVIQ